MAGDKTQPQTPPDGSRPHVTRAAAHTFFEKSELQSEPAMARR